MLTDDLTLPEAIKDKFGLVETPFFFGASYRRGLRIYEYPQTIEPEVIVSISETDRKGNPAKRGRVYLWLKVKEYVFGNLVVHSSRYSFTPVRVTSLEAMDRQEFDALLVKKIRRL